jgi:NAD(P)-dependent dehydrogenase (short-subunit alcohol dehydrogenase family)
MNYDYSYGNNFYEFDLKNCKGLKCTNYSIIAPPQEQKGIVGIESIMCPRPIFDDFNYVGSGKLEGKVAIITGGDSGLGRAAAIAFAKEGADLVIPYYNEHGDALETKKYIEQIGRRCLLLDGDISDKSFCNYIVNETLKMFGKIDILVNNAGVQYQQDNLECISDEQFDWTMKVNIYGMFYLTRAVLPYLSEGSSIINLSSITTFDGEPRLIDYVTTKGAIVGFTRSLAKNLALKKIRVNAIAPGFFWTPLQPNCWEAEVIPTLGSDSAMARGAMPYELAPTYVYLASEDSRYVTGQVIHVNGGQYLG